MRTRHLIVVTPEGEREVLFIGRLTIGRAPECDVSLADAKISRRHAEFDASGPMPRVTDLGSRNGILVNGRKVGAADLVPGDVVTVGDASVRLEERATDVELAEAEEPFVDDHTLVLSPMMSPVPPTLPPPVLPAGTRPMLPGDAIGDWAYVGVGPDRVETGALPRRDADDIAPSEALPADEDEEHTTLLPAPQRADAAANRLPDPFRAMPDVTDSAPRVAPAPLPPAVPSPPPVPTFEATAAVAPAGPPAVSAAPSTRLATGSALTVPRLSWGGLVMLAALLLGGLAVLLGALPLTWTSSSALDALSERQARTLAGWLATGTDPRAGTVVDPAVMEAVLAQPGVDRAMVLERATGRAIAPAAVAGVAYSALPGLGGTWRELSAARVSRVGAFTDAYVPAGRDAYIAWVRYERPSSSTTGLAIGLALVATLVLAVLIALLLERQTKATLQHFTRQVELAVSGASPTVMQGTLMPGLERLPGVVTSLLEQRRDGGTMPASGHEQIAGDQSSLSAVTAPPIDPGPPWLEVTPSLTVAAASAHGPDAGAADWRDARGRHLLDVLDSAPVRNAVVQGLGALSLQSGSEATVPLAGGASIALRRESSGHVRVTLGKR